MSGEGYGGVGTKVWLGGAVFLPRVRFDHIKNKPCQRGLNRAYSRVTVVLVETVSNAKIVRKGLTN